MYCQILDSVTRFSISAILYISVHNSYQLKCYCLENCAIVIFNSIFTYFHGTDNFCKIVTHCHVFRRSPNSYILMDFNK